MIALPVQHAPAHLRRPDGLSVRTARLTGWVGLILSVALPAILWRRPISMVAADFTWQFDYFLGWVGYTLIVAAVLFMLPVVFYPRSRNALVGWSVSLYVLGCAIATQVATIAGGFGDG
jgi:hypothetical protein